MSKNILIISSDNTGHGHKSITESLYEKIRARHDVNIHVIDGFSLGGQFLINIGKSYGPITRSAEGLWKIIWKFSSIKPSLINVLIEVLIKNSFLKLIDEVNPDLILSVHPNFNGSIINILEKHKLKIPFITLIADLVNIYPLWADKRADYIISPTNEAKDMCLKYGIPEEKIKVFGFPVRSRFYRKSNNLKSTFSNKNGIPFKCLIMSGGEGVGNMKNIAENLLDHFNCTVKIVAGRNVKLKKKLEQELINKYGNKVEIYGFTKNIQDLMFSSDIAFTRGSPNVMFEAVSSNTPIIITGALPGQEESNPDFAEKYNLGVICRTTSQINKTINSLLENDCEKLNSIIISQKRFINTHTAEDIVRFILKIEHHYVEPSTVLSYN